MDALDLNAMTQVCSQLIVYLITGPRTQWQSLFLSSKNEQSLSSQYLITAGGWRN
jgi:hypothetical protein